MICCSDDQADHRDHRRQVERSDGRDEAPEDPQVRIADVVEEALQPVQPRPVGQPDERGQDVGEDQEDVDVDERVHEALNGRGRVEEQRQNGEMVAHGSELRSGTIFPTSRPTLELVSRESGSFRGLRAWGIRFCGCPIAHNHAWLKKPPRSSMRARSSAETSTLRGVSRKTLSATRCMPPSSA